MRTHKYTFSCIANDTQSDAGKARSYTATAYTEEQARAWVERDNGKYCHSFELILTDLSDEDKAIDCMIMNGGAISGGINWTWVTFTDDAFGEKCFEECKKLWPGMDHCGYSKASPDSPNTNLHHGGFRFR